jgi:hypothetical protein
LPVSFSSAWYTTSLPSGLKYPSPARTKSFVTWVMLVRYFASAAFQSAGGAPCDAVANRPRESSSGVIGGPEKGIEAGRSSGLLYARGRRISHPPRGHHPPQCGPSREVLAPALRDPTDGHFGRNPDRRVREQVDRQAADGEHPDPVPEAAPPAPDRFTHRVDKKRYAAVNATANPNGCRVMYVDVHPSHGRNTGLF